MDRYESLQFRPTRTRDNYTALTFQDAKYSSEEHGTVLVAAIDFGTTYSGYAFSFTTSPETVHMNKNWGEALGYQSYKTPTTVLTGLDHHFVAFGHEAEEKFTTSVESDGEGKYHIYRQFKMLLHHGQISKSTVITSTSGHKRRALDIFAMAIRYLKDHLLEAVSRSVESQPSASLIKWVITVPAIWSEEAKQFMREAALKAGCISSRNSKRLVIALEPEAASIYCRNIKLDPLSTMGKISKVAFKAGVQYLIIDAGGGTIDITAHEVLRNGSVKEISVANGGDWGGTRVDENFVHLLEQILGKQFITTYQKQCPQQWLNLMMAFEKTKKTVKDDAESRISLQLSWALGGKYKEVTGQNFDQAINAHKDKGVSFKNGCLVVDNNASIALFTPVINQITQHIQGLLRSSSTRKITCVMLVGGFGESPLLQSAIKQLLPSQIKLLVPPESQLAVIKGALSFAQKPQIVESRYVRKTYGVDVEPWFNENIHNRQKLVKRGGRSYCNDVFLKYVDKGTPIDATGIIKKNLKARTPDQKHMSVDIYATDETSLAEVEYVDDTKFRRVGGLTVYMPNTTGGVDREVEVAFRFGGTEIQVSATDLTSRETAETVVNMLYE